MDLNDESTTNGSKPHYLEMEVWEYGVLRCRHLQPSRHWLHLHSHSNSPSRQYFGAGRPICRVPCLCGQTCSTRRNLLRKCITSRWLGADWSQQITKSHFFQSFMWGR